MKYKISLFLFILTTVIYAQKAQLKKGDILFQDLDCELCEAIETVTTGYGGMNFSHCAMVVSTGDTTKVIEAVGKGVRLTELGEFLSREEGSVYIMGRLKPEKRYLIGPAVDYAMQQLEKPYDKEFLPDNGKWYCSELIYASFKEANNGKEVFSLEPMTFKDPGTGEFMEAWKEYYKALNMEIPEGIPGINPGGISRSTDLNIVPVRK